MFTRPAPEQTISDLMQSIETSPLTSVVLPPSEVHVDIPARTIGLGNIEVPLTVEGIKAFGDALDIPVPFLLRQDPDFQQVLVQTILGRSGGSSTYAYGPSGLVEIRDPRTQVISPMALLGVAARVIDHSAPVRDFWSNSSDFRLDVFAPVDFDRGVGGDPMVGDISQAGIRIQQDRKHNLAPSVTPFQYRLFCTNGMTTRFDEARVDARGSNVAEVLAEFEIIADLAFRRAESDMASFYALRADRLDHPERTLLRMAQDAGLPDRTVTRLLERVPSLVDDAEDGTVSMFDLVNLITNQANDPSVRRSGARLALEAAGGSIVSDHAERCNTCQSRLVHV